jgi:hypothetical protein
LGDEGATNFTYTRIINSSYPCADHDPCLFGVNIPFRTANLLLESTGLETYASNQLYDAYHGGPPASRLIIFMFTLIHSPTAPIYWLFTVLYGCLFYYCATWLLVKGVAFFRQRG